MPKKSMKVPPKILDLYNKEHQTLMQLLEEIKEKMVININTHTVDITYFLMSGDWNPREIAQKILKILQPERLTILLYLFKRALYDTPDSAAWTRKIARDLNITRKDVSENLNFLANLGLVYRVRANTPDFAGYKRYVYNLLTPQGLKFVRDLLILMLPLIERLEEE